jgi:hypothetical protein
MIQQLQCVPQVDSCRMLSPFHWRALRLLSEAWLAARSQRQDVWQFAVEIEQLRALGLSYTDVRCLLYWNYLEHAQERTTARSSQRIFLPLKALVLPKRTCFVLTAKGREIAWRSCAETAQGDGPSPEESAAALRCAPLAPRWDEQACQLWWGKDLIKKFRRPAINQELVLAALEEEGWPPRIDDPLPPTDNIDPKVRLHDTIKALNRHHLHRIIRFVGDGRARGIQWVVEKRD